MSLLLILEYIDFKWVKSWASCDSLSLKSSRVFLNSYIQMTIAVFIVALGDLALFFIHIIKYILHTYYCALILPY